jgi:hypothetical protein
VKDHVGGIIHGTSSGIDHALTLDNTDIRATTLFPAGGAELRIGISLNNGPIAPKSNPRGH